jgi:NADH-quinone oxidoreductase subunit G
VAAVPVLAEDGLTRTDSNAITTLADRSGALSGEAFRSGLGDFYLTNPIARASKVMAECSKLARTEHLEAAE